MNRTLAILAKTSITKLLKFKWIYKLMKKMTSGKIGLNIHVAAAENKHQIIYVKGHDEGNITGMIASYAASNMV